jgi:23S rRNA pseudouridine1911/1915/1917 synthase
MTTVEDAQQWRVVQVIAGADDAGERADVVLGRHEPTLSRRVARALAHAGHLTIDDVPAPPAQRVQAGARLELRLPIVDTEPPPPLEVLAVTPRLVYVSKPSGLHTHRLRPSDPVALADLVATAFPECAGASKDPREGGAVHRLDLGTSGVVAFARAADVHAAARAAFTAGTVIKHYLALVTCPKDLVWPPPAGRWRVPVGDAVEVRAPIGSGDRPDRVVVARHGQPTLSVIERPQPRGEARALVTLELRTGRRHQARVHLAWLALPIVGDDLYSGEPAARLHLHALRLDLRALDADEPVVTAPPPPALT